MRSGTMTIASYIALLIILLTGSACTNTGDSGSSGIASSGTSDIVTGPDDNAGDNGGDDTDPGDDSDTTDPGDGDPGDGDPGDGDPGDGNPSDGTPGDGDPGDGDDGGGTTNRSSRSCQATDGPVEPKTIFHIGHSLTDRMAPLLNAIIEADTGQLVDFGYKTSSGTSIKNHWSVTPDGNGKGNLPRPYSPLEVIQTPGMIDVLSMTEKLPMSYVKGEHADSWAREFLAHSTHPNPEVFIYATFYQRKVNEPDDAESIETWLAAFDDWEPHWQNVAQIVLDALPDANVGIIPVGRVLEELQLRVLEGSLVLPNGLTFRETFFKRNRPGRYGGCETRDHIHLSRAGIYAAALTHYATIFCASPIGLPSTLPYRGYSDGCIEAEEVFVDPDLAAEIQEVVWQVVQEYEWSGVE